MGFEIKDYSKVEDHDKIIENNKILANYMGYTYFPSEAGTNFDAGWKINENTSSTAKINKLKFGTREDYLCRNHNQLYFHSDWNWLMRVVNRLMTKDGYIVMFYSNVASVMHKEDFTRPKGPTFGLPIHYTNTTYSESEDTLILAVWEAVVLTVRHITASSTTSDDQTV